jgi:hypothetical protein
MLEHASPIGQAVACSPVSISEIHPSYVIEGLPLYLAEVSLHNLELFVEAGSHSRTTPPPPLHPTNTRAGSQRTRLYFVPNHTPTGAKPRRSVALALPLKREQGRLETLIDRQRRFPLPGSLLPCGLPPQRVPVSPRIVSFLPVALAGRRRLALLPARLGTTTAIGDHGPTPPHPLGAAVSGDPGRTRSPAAPSDQHPTPACQHRSDVLCFWRQAGTADAAVDALRALSRTADSPRYWAALQAGFAY